MFNELILGSLSLLFAGLFTRMVINRIKGYKLEEAGRRLPAMFPVDQSRLCKGPHSWENAVIAVPGREMSQHLICTECGLISGTEYMMNTVGLLSLNAQLAQRSQDLEDLARLEEMLQHNKKQLIDDYIGKLGFEGTDEDGRQLLKAMHDDVIASYRDCVLQINQGK